MLCNRIGIVALSALALVAAPLAAEEAAAKKSGTLVGVQITGGETSGLKIDIDGDGTSDETWEIENPGEGWERRIQEAFDRECIHVTLDDKDNDGKIDDDEDVSFETPRSGN